MKKFKEVLLKLETLEVDYKKLQASNSTSDSKLNLTADLKVLKQQKKPQQDLQVVPSTQIIDESEKIISKSAPPIPPPLPTKFFAFNGPQSPNKNIPKSKLPMKCFNWSKLPLNSYEKTLWKNVNDENVYKLLDLDEFQKIFSAYQKPNESDSLRQSASISTTVNQHSINDFSSLGSISKSTRKEFSVIDFTRGRNLSILLSKLKMTTNELKTILLNMDANDDLPKDMIDQLLKFIPTAEEEALLEDNISELTNMAKADRFLYECSKIFRYKQKLEILCFKKKYLERYKEIRQKVEAVTKCCQILKSSKNVVQLLEIVLALGNFMNQNNKKGVAVGFSILNLNKLIDIKSSNERSFSLLHFLIVTIQDKVNRGLKR